MKYIRGTRDLTLILIANVIGVLKWWIDAYYEVHTNMWGHTGGIISMGIGFNIVNWTNKKLNTRGLTESDIVGVHAWIPDVCWTRYFMGVQGYQFMETIFTKTTREPLSWRRMRSHQVASATRIVPVQEVHFFYTRSHWVHFKTVRYFSQSIFSFFSYLKMHNTIQWLNCVMHF